MKSLVRGCLDELLAICVRQDGTSNNDGHAQPRRVWLRGHDRVFPDFRFASLAVCQKTAVETGTFDDTLGSVQRSRHQPRSENSGKVLEKTTRQSFGPCAHSWTSARAVRWLTIPE